MRARPEASGDLWAITSYFNPIGYRRRLENYRTFQRNLGIPLLTLEQSIGGRVELSPNDATILLQVTSDSVMWQKERLLNLALKHLPPECRKVAWVDCDILFDRGDWALQTSETLDRAMLCQLFSRVLALPKDVDFSRSLAAQSYLERKSAASQYVADGGVGLDPVGLIGVSARFSAGYAWAARRQILQDLNFYDARILGGGDFALLQAALGQFDAVRDGHQMNASQFEHYLEWARQFHSAINGRLHVVPGDIYHLWHGDLKDRNYSSRHSLLSRFDFDPYRDIAIDQCGCWRWGSDKPDLHAAVRDYFRDRCEDGRVSQQDC